MASTTVDSQPLLDDVQRSWVEKMAALLEVDLSGTAVQTSDGSALQSSSVVARPDGELSLASGSKGAVVRRSENASKYDVQTSPREAGKKKKAPATPPIPPPPATDQEKYNEELPNSEERIRYLKNHRQTKLISAEIGKAEAHVAKAKDLAKKSQYANALREFKAVATVFEAAWEFVERTARTTETEISVREDFNNLKLHQGVERVGAEEIKKIDDKIKQLGPLIKAKKFDEFDDSVSSIRINLEFWKKVANDHGDYVGLRNNSLAQVRALEAHPEKDSIKKEIEAIHKLIDEGKKEYDSTKDFRRARTILLNVGPKYLEAKKKADKGGKADFQKEFAAVNLKVKGLQKPELKNPIVDGEVAAIKAKLGTAVKYAAAKQYPESMKLLVAVAKDVERVEKLAAEQVAANRAQKAAGTATANIVKDSKAAIEAVQKFHDQVKAHPQAALIKPQLAEVQKTIDQAKTALA